MTVEAKGCIQAVQQTLRQFGSLGGFRAVFAEQAEFVTAQPGQGAAGRQIVLQALANALEQQIADVVIEAFIDVLEVVEVDQQYRTLQFFVVAALLYKVRF